MLDNYQLLRHKLKNSLQSLALLSTMGLLLLLIGWLLGGDELLLALLLAGGMTLFVIPSFSPHWLMQLYGARSLSVVEAPELFRLVALLSSHAGQSRPPRLYYLPSATRNAFTLGHSESAALALSDGLLRTLNYRELAGVIAHEISHIRNHDTLVMSLADTLSRFTRLLSILGQLLILLNLPLYLFSDAQLPWLALLLLIMAPSLSALLQLALSRTREFDADLEAVRLTGDPDGLASALARIEYSSTPWFRRLFWPAHHSDQPSLLRTHPETSERIERLLALSGKMPRAALLQHPVKGMPPLHAHLPPVARAVRRHWHGYHH